MPLRGTGGRDETTPLWRNWLEPKKRLENAASPTTTLALAGSARVAPAYFAGGRVHAVLATAIGYKPTWLLCVFKRDENVFLNLSNS